MKPTPPGWPRLSSAVFCQNAREAIDWYQRAFGFTVGDLAAMGVRRISVGGTLARVAMHAFIKSARDIADPGKFDSFAGVMPNAELNAFFHDDLKKRQS